MSTPMPYTPDEDELAVLGVLREERRVNPLRVRERTGLRKQYVNDALRQLAKVNVVRRVNRGLYEYVAAEDDLAGCDEVDVLIRLPRGKVEDAVLLAEYVAEENDPPPEALRWARWLRAEILAARGGE